MSTDALVLALIIPLVVGGCFGLVWWLEGCHDRKVFAVLSKHRFVLGGLPVVRDGWCPLQTYRWTVDGISLSATAVFTYGPGGVQIKALLVGADGGAYEAQPQSQQLSSTDFAELAARFSKRWNGILTSNGPSCLILFSEPRSSIEEAIDTTFVLARSLAQPGLGRNSNEPATAEEPISFGDFKLYMHVSPTPILLWSVTVLVVVSCLGLMFSAAAISQDAHRQAALAERAKDWPSTNAKLLKCSREGSGRYERGDLKYSYTISGTTHTQSRYRFGVDGNDQELFDFIAKHRPMQNITVYFNPADPQDAVILTGVGSDPVAKADRITVACVSMSLTLIAVLAMGFWDEIRYRTRLRAR